MTAVRRTPSSRRPAAGNPSRTRNRPPRRPRPNGISRSGLITELKELVDPERPVPVIAIAVGPDADRDEVAEIARVTGGDGYEVSDPAEIQAVILQAIMAAGQNGRAAQE